MSTPRRSFTPELKATILKRYLVDKTPLSDLCDEYQIQPNQIYKWQKMLFDGAPGLFERNCGPRKSVNLQEQKIAALQTKLADKNEVIAELMQDHVLLKKSLGET
jgi:transposase-like protein